MDFRFSMEGFSLRSELASRLVGFDRDPFSKDREQLEAS